MMVFVAVCGMVTVDSAYSEMLDQQGKLVPSIRRVNSEYIVVSMFGQSAAINTRELGEDWEELQETVVDNLDGAVTAVRETLGIEEEERNYDAFEAHIL